MLNCILRVVNLVEGAGKSDDAMDFESCSDEDDNGEEGSVVDMD
jgi:hypothetical protein